MLSMKKRVLSLFQFQMTSNDFFAAYNPRSILDWPIDFAFLDGLHLFEYMLSNFANVECFCQRDSIVARMTMFRLRHRRVYVRCPKTRWGVS
jgi:hypothetical protein